ncbi:plasmid stabilization protein, partial [Clostridioides difficile]|nr:plasmid stabilization protein [Clostridioides difficile]
TRLDVMESDIKDLKTGQVEIKDDLKEIKGDILKLDLKTEDTRRNIKLMQLDINKIETITNYNLNDIATLKAIK